MIKTVSSVFLIDAPASALNNAGPDVGARTDNSVAVKKFKKGNREFPYVSAQMLRYEWRKLLTERCDWVMSPITREKKIAFTGADPFNYPDDDIFGYMKAESKAKAAAKDKNKEVETTPVAEAVTRISPLKNSTLVSVYSAEIENDFGSMSRGEGNPVPFEHQFYSTVFKGAFSLDLYHAGRFSTMNKSGYKNLSQDWIEKNKEKIIELGAAEENGYWILPKEERKKRIKDTISVLPYFYGMAKQSGHLTDITPKFIILAVMEGGNNPFMSITYEDYGTYQSDLDRSKFINVKALKEVISDYSNEIISDIYIGRREGFQDNISDELEALKNEFKGEKEIHLLSPKNAVEEFVKIIENHVE